VRKFTNINNIKENKSDSLRDMLKNHDNIVLMKFIPSLGFSSSQASSSSIFDLFTYLFF
jgi:hypothetical protein